MNNIKCDATYNEAQQKSSMTSASVDNCDNYWSL